MRSEAGRFTEMVERVAAGIFGRLHERLRIAGERLRDLVRFLRLEVERPRVRRRAGDDGVGTGHSQGAGAKPRQEDLCAPRRCAAWSERRAWVRCNLAGDRANATGERTAAEVDDGGEGRRLAAAAAGGLSGYVERGWIRETASLDAF